MSGADEWREEVRREIEGAAVPWLTTLMVLDETTSTQDIAREVAQPGSVVIARVQTAGRGRLGRRWEPTAGKGLAISITIEAQTTQGPRLSVMSGLAALRAARACLAQHAGRVPIKLGLRWPNDVVTRRLDGGPDRKVAGVLIERCDNLFVVGIGMNITQCEADWPQGLNAVSLRQLGASITVGRAAAALLASLTCCQNQSDEELAVSWDEADTLTGRRCEFDSAGHLHSGIVHGLHPLRGIELEDDRGNRQFLDAAVTTLLAVG
ncbi:MAG: hypothetical protein JNK25_00320 [Phycisphaerae bacterium]|nr:hypothetical protein [Phycisphaerae bacterium]